MKSTPQGSYEVTALSVEDLEQLGFDTSKITNSDMAEIARKMDLSAAFWDSLECVALKYGVKKVK